jgi:hypothetical protein
MTDNELVAVGLLNTFAVVGLMTDNELAAVGLLNTNNGKAKGPVVVFSAVCWVLWYFVAKIAYQTPPHPTHEQTRPHPKSKSPRRHQPRRTRLPH